MMSAGTDQSLLLSVREWKTDTFGATGLYYDLELEALNAQDQVLAKQSTRGEEELGGSAWMFVRSRILRKWRRKRSSKKSSSFSQAILPMHWEPFASGNTPMKLPTPRVTVVRPGLRISAA